ncbi:NAD(P)-binding domain-containing protein [Mycobacterium lepromatosis]|uniref:NAD(P)-binding domain-containing protein n=1 Tax=Mycobacterium lepromatosis TaxID=480418 RepID=UPI0006990469|nr:NAD(P)-binding domain-containing protein [Mycobacterium lepromatosis]
MTKLFKIAFLGKNNTEAPMSADMVGAEHTLRGFDPVLTAVAAAVSTGLSMFDGATAVVAKADVVITILPNGNVIKCIYAEMLDGSSRACTVNRQFDELGKRRSGRCMR